MEEISVGDLIRIDNKYGKVVEIRANGFHKKRLFGTHTEDLIIAEMELQWGNVLQEFPISQVEKIHR